MGMTQDEHSRFLGKTEKQGDCLIYNGQKDIDGYGIFFFRRKSRRAHRVIYWHHFGDIPKNMVVNHVCGHRDCVAIEHLRLATWRENALRESQSIPAQNAKKTHCKNGHPFDRFYGKQRYCSICQAEKTKRLRAKWKAQDTVSC